MNEFPRQLPHGSGATLVLDDSRLLIELADGASRQDVEAALDDVDLAVEPDRAGEHPGERTTAEVVNHTDTRLWVQARSAGAIDDGVHLALREVLGPMARWIAPVYETPGTPGRGGRVCPLPHVLVLRSAGDDADDGDGGRDPLAGVARRLGLEEDTERSRYLPGFRVFVVPHPEERNAYELRDVIAREAGARSEDVKFETMPMLRDLTLVPDDTLYPQQWNMRQVVAGGTGTTAWDLSTGTATVTVAVLDYGFDLTHPDLAYAPGVHLGTMTTLTTADSGTEPHGTACAGIVAASIGNAAGVAGMAGACTIMPVRRVSGSDVETAVGIGWAASNGARVLSMSFGRYGPGEGAGPTGWDFTVIDPAIADAVTTRGRVLCAATGNEDLGTVNRYPARHPLVIACGASDQADARKSPASPDGEPWGSNFGTNVHGGVTTGVSVVAPGVLIPTTDVRGTAGYNPATGAAGDYTLSFNGTSSATPHVAGLAALLWSAYPTTTGGEIRALIERTADKVGPTPYAEVAGFPNGSRNQQMGYGRINAFRALDCADLVIRDHPSDSGAEPSSPPAGNFWDFSDVVVRPVDDGVFDPGNPAEASRVERGQTNHVYVRVTNRGPSAARNVAVTVRITPFAGLEFAYPADWTAVDATHVSPTPVVTTFATVAPGASVTATFTVSAAQVDTLWGWATGSSWHPCLLAAVSADNDHASSSTASVPTPHTPRRNDLAQRNLTVVDDVLAGDATFPFLAGHPSNGERSLEVVVDRRWFGGKAAHLVVDDEQQRFIAPVHEAIEASRPRPGDDRDGIELLERTRVRARVGCCDGVLVLEKGSRIVCDGERRRRLTVEGGEVLLRDGVPVVRLTDDVCRVRVDKEPGEVIPMALHVAVPAGAAKGRPLVVRVAQRDERGVTVGGATAVYLAGDRDRRDRRGGPGRKA